MSLQDTVAEFEAQARLLLDLPQNIADEALAQVTRVGNRYDNILATQTVNVFVNQITGDDSNDGSVNSPLATLQAALDLTPQGGICLVNLQSDYHVSANVTIGRKRLTLRSDATSIKRRLTFEVFATSELYYGVAGLLCGGNTSVSLHDLTVVWPAKPASMGSRTSGGASMFGSMEYAFFDLNLFSCALELPANPAVRFCHGLSTNGLFVLACIYTGAKTSANGWWFNSYSSEAGTSINSAGSVISNLTTI